MERNVAKEVWNLLLSRPKESALGLLQLIIGNILYLAVPLLFRNIQTLFAQGATLTHTRVDLFIYSALLLGLTLLSTYCKYRTRNNLLDLSLKAENGLKAKLFAKIQSSSESFYDRYSTGALMNYFTQDLQFYRDMLRIGLFAPLNLLTLVLPALLALAWISIPLTLITAIPLVLVPLVMWNVMRWIYRLSTKRQEILGDMSAFAHESFTGIRLIKASGIEKGFIDHMQRLGLKLYKVSLKLHTLECSFFPFIVTITRLVTLSLVITSAGMIYLNVGNLLTNDFLSFMWIQSYLLFPIMIFGWALPLIQKGKAAYDRLYFLYSWQDPVKDEGIADLQIPKQPSIRIRDLSFTYPGEVEPALKEISLNIPSGASWAITGPLGSGKSTLLKLLLRGYETPKGAIEIGGEPIQNYPIDELLQKIALIEQSPFFLSDSLLENIRMGKREATEEEVEQVIQEADLLETVESFPSRHFTMVGERGVTLSGGQKRRLAVARTLIADRPLLLLDDVFSALDVETEQRLFKQLKRRFNGKTTLFVGHKASILLEFDWLVYLSKGRIIEQGPPKELLKRKESAFSALYNLQKQL